MVRERLKKLNEERLTSAKEGGMISDIDVEFFERVFLVEENKFKGAENESNS
jgi:hypothetical protein